jgi:hypothetical protein
MVSEASMLLQFSYFYACADSDHLRHGVNQHAEDGCLWTFGLNNNGQLGCLKDTPYAVVRSPSNSSSSSAQPEHPAAVETGTVH